MIIYKMSNIDWDKIVADGANTEIKNMKRVKEEEAERSTMMKNVLYFIVFIVILLVAGAGIYLGYRKYTHQIKTMEATGQL